MKNWTMIIVTIRGTSKVNTEVVIDPLTAMLIMAAVSGGISYLGNKQQVKAQERAQTSMENEAKFSAGAEAQRTQQIANTAASNVRRRRVISTKQPVQNSGMTPSNGGADRGSASSGTF